LSEDGEIKVTKQVILHLSIGKYRDEVFFHVVPMKESHVLLEEFIFLHLSPKRN